MLPSQIDSYFKLKEQLRGFTSSHSKEVDTKQFDLHLDQQNGLLLQAEKDNARLKSEVKALENNRLVIETRLKEQQAEMNNQQVMIDRLGEKVVKYKSLC